MSGLFGGGAPAPPPPMPVLEQPAPMPVPDKDAQRIAALRDAAVANAGKTSRSSTIIGGDSGRSESLG